MDYKLNQFNLQLKVTHLANVSYFEFTKNYHTKTLTRSENCFTLTVVVLQLNLKDTKVF